MGKWRLKLLTTAANLGLEDKFDKICEGRPTIITMGQFLVISFDSNTKVYINASQVLTCSVQRVDQPENTTTTLKRGTPAPVDEGDE